MSCTSVPPLWEFPVRSARVAAYKRKGEVLDLVLLCFAGVYQRRVQRTKKEIGKKKRDESSSSAGSRDSASISSVVASFNCLHSRRLCRALIASAGRYMMSGRSASCVEKGQTVICAGARNAGTFLKKRSCPWLFCEKGLSLTPLLCLPLN